MRKLTQLVLLSVALLATPAFAEMKVAVLNYQMALLESDAAKRYAVDAEKKFGPQLNKLKTLESDAKRIQDRLVKDGEKCRPPSVSAWSLSSSKRPVTSSFSLRN